MQALIKHCHQKLYRLILEDGGAAHGHAAVHEESLWPTAFRGLAEVKQRIHKNTAYSKTEKQTICIITASQKTVFAKRIMSKSPIIRLFKWFKFFARAGSAKKTFEKWFPKVFLIHFWPPWPTISRYREKFCIVSRYSNGRQWFFNKLDIFYY